MRRLQAVIAALCLLLSGGAVVCWICGRMSSPRPWSIGEMEKHYAISSSAHAITFAWFHHHPSNKSDLRFNHVGIEIVRFVDPPAPTRGPQLTLYMVEISYLTLLAVLLPYPAFWTIRTIRRRQ